MMAQISGQPPTMWGSSMVGFGRYAYRYETGQSGEWFLVGFANRANALVLYFSDGLESHAPSLAKLGEHRLGKSCLYLKSLKTVDTRVLAAMIAESIATTRARWPSDTN